MPQELKNVLLLGDGFLTGFVAQALKTKAIEFDVTSRTKPNRIRFDFEDKTSWPNISKTYSHSLITFPLSKPELAIEFLESQKSLLGKLVIVSSTGFFKVSDGAKVNESSPLDLTKERVQAEESLRKQGAIVLHASGIYGPGRNPLDWVKEGRVGKSDKLVNFIHVEDLAEFCIQCMIQAKPGSRYIASDEKTMSWNEIIAQWTKQFQIESIEKASKRTSKRVDASRSRKALGIKLQYPSVIDGVSKID